MEKLARMCYILSMGRRFFLVRIILAVLIFSVFALPAGAQGFLSRISWLVDGSVLFFPEDNGTESDPMPVLPSLGFGASCQITKISKMNLALELTLDFYYTHYGYSDNLERAIPQAIENRSSLVIGSVLAVQAAFSFDLTQLMTLRAFIGPAADLRIVVLAEKLTQGLDDISAIRAEVDLVRKYFWSQGRWLLPVMGTGLDFTLNSRFKLGLDFRVWMPMYRLWTGEDLPAIEGWRFGIGFRLTIR